MKSSSMKAASSQSVALACATAAVVALTGYQLFFNNSNADSKDNSKDNKDEETLEQQQENIKVDDEDEDEAASSTSRNNNNNNNNNSIPTKIDMNTATDNSLRRIQTPNTITIAYASTTGTCQSFAKSLLQSLNDIIIQETNVNGTVNGIVEGAVDDNGTARAINNSNVHIQICTVDELDWWDELLNEDQTETDNDNQTPPTTNTSTNTNTNTVNVKLPPMVIFVLPTWTNGTLPEQYASLTTSLDEIAHDWRVAPRPLRTTNTNDSDKTSTRLKHKSDTKTIQIASFGMGSTAYDKSTFCKPAKDTFKLFMKLGARSLLVSHGKGVVGTGDDDAGDCKKSFHEWKIRVVDRVGGILKGQVENYLKLKESQTRQHLSILGSKSNPSSSTSTSTGCCQSQDNKGQEVKNTSCGCQEEKSSLEQDGGGGGGGCCSSNDNNNSNDDEVDVDDDDDEDNYSDYPDSDSDDESSYNEEEKEEPDVIDLEDIGNAIQSSSSTNNKSSTSSSSKKFVKEMVTPKQAISLKKEGYKIIGTHSAVKLCRWTKHQLRGRGGCYKHTFYGITSYQCMEATPSLACANKCVFCWRHHKNPVGREWRWKIDDPYEIVDAAVKQHVAMIKETKGIPGVLKERWEEAHTVRHCALSLVGEPIMYPRIDEFLGDLHARSISTFLVTNGQHPKAIGELRPITQLYVSVDASTPETLEAVDRPLFKDAWDRLRTSLKSLKSKGQRTVARLTVVKGWNSDEISGYAKLIALGHCSLVEIKGVTFCGKSDASNLNMSNSPWHHEVVALAENLKIELAKLRDAAGRDDKEKVPEYGLACEHKHSCSVLLARVDQFATDDPVTGSRKWRTWIDYDKFDRLAAQYAEDPTFTFGVEDYVADTPDWAIFGAEEEGFDPTDTRHRRKKKYPKYTKFDSKGIPTHDDDGNPLEPSERSKLMTMMVKKKNEVGDGVSVIDLKGGEKVIDDASLMFRGLTVTK